MDNNPLTYILTTLNLDALGHHWVAALASYNMKLEYLKGSDNKVADALSRISMQKLDEETITELLNYAEMANIHVIEEGKRVDQEVIVRYTQIVKQHRNFWNLANQDWVRAQSGEPVIPQVIKWIQRPRKDHRKLKEYLVGVASDCKSASMLPSKRNLPCRIICCTFRSPPPIARTWCQSLSFRLWIGKPL